MATTGKARNLETFVKQQLAGAQKQFKGLEQGAKKQFKGLEQGAKKQFKGLELEANKVLRTIKARSRGPAREVEKFLGQINPDVLLENPKVKELGRKATQVRSQLARRLDGIQTRAVEAVGVASQAQVKELNRELSRLAKKIDQIVPGSAKKAAPRADSRVSAP
jgi:hypothetical protein